MKPRSLWSPREPGAPTLAQRGVKVRKMTPKLVRKIRALVARIHAEGGFEGVRLKNLRQRPSPGRTVP